MRLGEAAILAETVREQVAGQPFTAGGHALAVSISAGVALLMADAHSAYQSADAALYRAKSGGATGWKWRAERAGGLPRYAGHGGQHPARVVMQPGLTAVALAASASRTTLSAAIPAWRVTAGPTERAKPSGDWPTANMPDRQRCSAWLLVRRAWAAHGCAVLRNPLSFCLDFQAAMLTNTCFTMAFVAPHQPELCRCGMA